MRDRCQPRIVSIWKARVARRKFCASGIKHGPLKWGPVSEKFMIKQTIDANARRVWRDSCDALQLLVYACRCPKPGEVHQTVPISMKRV
ncbi:hypothetical protein BQ8794_30404 [Mesorhizobium prunaredense]|uniref:Uncharacterized protein n=1 Tax=Mesorhizobium prunaredense TaxID=1631249 RepID=A0A1R3VAX8_9HYPH|nr:hypothetical protein BQ8794_30404 [Mesorhizobium prunaredense]